MSLINGNTDVIVDINYLQDQPACQMVSTRALAQQAINEFQYEGIDSNLVTV